MTAPKPARPTAGPWRADPRHPAGVHWDTIIRDGNGDPICSVYAAGWNRDTHQRHVQLLTAAGTAAHEAAALGFDPVGAVRALPRLLEALELLEVVELVSEGEKARHYSEAAAALAAARGER